MVIVHLWLLVLNAAAVLAAAGRRCPPLPVRSFPHGRIIKINREQIWVACNEGYRLAGKRELRCYRGKWNFEHFPECYLANNHCPPLPEIPNADKWGDDTHEGAVIQYVCHPGYVMLGTGKRRCNSMHIWSGRPPVCQSENESLAAVTDRLQKHLINNIGSHSADSHLRILGPEDIKRGLELMILLDHSSSVDPSDFKIGIEFAKFLVEEFGVRNGNNAFGTRLAVITFGDKAELAFNLNDSNVSSVAEAKRRLDQLQPQGGGTAMQDAFSLVFTHIVSVGILRQNAKRALFLITDGEPNIGKEPPEAIAAPLKQFFGFEIFTFGIGNDINRTRLVEIASNPPLNHVFVLNAYSDFNKMLWLMKNHPTPVPPPSPEQCGYLPSEVAAEPSDFRKTWPWLVAIYVKVPVTPKPAASPLAFCAGVLVCRQWVLTAARCFFFLNGGRLVSATEGIYATLGDQDLMVNEGTELNFYADKVVLHPKFNPQADLQHNLALVKLNAPVPLNMTYRPVCLPPSAAMTLPFSADPKTIAKLAGWGSAGTKKDHLLMPSTIMSAASQTSLPVGEEGDCQKKMKKRLTSETMFCAGYGVPTNGSCVGSLGSPLVVMDPQTKLHHTIGLLSDSSSCTKDYAIFIRIRHYINWINHVTNLCPTEHG